MLFSLRNTPQIRAQRELLNDAAVLWYNAVCAPIFATENKDWKIFGGYWAGKKERMQADYQILQTEYSAVNRQELMDKLYEIAQTGERFHYNHLMNEYQNRGFFELSREQICMDTAFPHLSLYQRRWLYDMIAGYKTYEEKALLGYDISRAIYGAQLGFTAGHLGAVEALTLCKEFGKTLQAAFSNWEEFTNSYLLGYEYYTQQDKQDLSSGLAQRIYLIERLHQEKGPFDLEWNVVLE